MTNEMHNAHPLQPMDPSPSEGEHTAGPWHVYDNRDLNGAFWIGTAPFVTLAQVQFGAEGPEYTGSEEANARLIAAAPDFAKVAPRASSFLQAYAEYIRTVPADELERHPYLPELEEVGADLRAASARATQDTRHEG